MTYYNEIEPFVAEWLRRLVLMGLISPGDVDSRSIEDVSADDLRPYRRCHFFAGIGLWDLSLQRAGWPDEREVWTGSCPCQPFSVAGQRRGFDDARHLWPAWYRLVGERRPAAILGEQIGGTAGRAWLDLVHADLEMAGYAVAAANIPAAGVGAPHIRQRLWFLAVSGQGRHLTTDEALCAGRKGSVPRSDVVDAAGQQAGLPRRAWEPGGSGVVGDTSGLGWIGRGSGEADARPQQPERSSDGELGQQTGLPGRAREPGGPGAVDQSAESGRPWSRSEPGYEQPRPPSPWSDVDWVACRDGKWRPVEPGTFPLAHGHTARVGKLRAYGNAIVPQVAQAFIEAAMECAP